MIDKKMTLEIELTFNENLSNKEEKYIVNKILNVLLNENRTKGLIVDCDQFIETITVKNNGFSIGRDCFTNELI